ncbi:MAG: hypothetical protein V4638_03550 [Bacteroidota bacterium]
MKLLILLIFTLFTLPIFGQLPKDWTGVYSGKMYILAENFKPDSVDLRITIEEKTLDSLWKFNMYYKSAKYPDVEKDYLIVYSKTKDRFYLDEQNGIIIDVTFLNNTLYEFYEVDNQFYAVTFKKTKEGLNFEIIGSSTNPSSETKSQPDQNNIVYNVFSLKPSFVQSAILKIKQNVE